MRRRLSFQFALVIILSILIFILGSSYLVQQNLNQVSELNLNQYLSMIQTDIDAGYTVDEIVLKYEDSNDYLRITFMDSTGVVLKDSLAEDLENHLTRPEFQNLGTAYIRHSATLNKDMMYLATQINDNLYLRVAIPISSVLPFLNDFIGFTIIVGLLLVVLSIFLVSQLTKSALRPLKELRTILTSVYTGEYIEIMPVEKYEEINDMINEINDISRLISSNIVSLNQEKEKNDFLLNHMNQGLCVLDKEGHIILVNQFIRDLFLFKEPLELRKDYLYLFRNQVIQKAIESAYLTQTNTSCLIQVQKEFYSVMVSYLPESFDHQPNVVLIFTDVTMVKDIETLKRDFFVNASHELKSPLTSIMGSAELITSKMVTDQATIQDLMNRILEESSRMNRLVMDMLSLSKYENQLAPVEEEMVNLKTVLEEIKQSITQKLDQKKMTYIQNAENLTYLANHEHMTEVFRNLIDNAIQYGNNGGTIKVTLKHTQQSIVFSVEDDGIGIPKTEQARVFERFYRVDKARSKKSGGTGLGLSIVKHICMLYQARIELESSEGKGTTITIVFPERK
ncbi:MAG: sensor histidine kinase [Candidatus Izemoplasmatales bacterium]